MIINGKLIKKIFSGIQSAGIYKIDWNADNLENGIYFLKLDSEKETQIQKLMLVK